MMTILAAEREIESLLSLHPKGYDLSLDRVRRLLDKLGNPQDRLPPVIHIAGTNGKGSCAAFSRALLEAAGYRVHTHTSPHLVHWNERYRLGAEGGGRLVEDKVFAEAIARAAHANGGETITVFEILTAVGFILFSEHPADVVILEVGLGGRFDATNVIPAPAVSVIMPISLDHQAYLGDRVELIAAEKAGIIKRGCPVVIGAQGSDAARQVLIETAERLDCPMQVYGQDFLAYGENGRMVYQDTDGLMDLPPPRLPGRHQFANAAAAIAGIKAAGLTISERAVEQAMVEVSWPGRMQKLAQGRLVDLAPPLPVYAFALRPKERKDDVKMSAAIQRLADEDPSLSLHHNQDSAETVLSGHGEMHLRVVRERLEGRNQIAVDGHPPAVAYRETIRKPVEQRGRHKKQSGGHGQFGDVVLQIKPLPRSSGFEFTDTITGGAVPKTYIQSVEAGIRDYMKVGPLGFPVVDVAVNLSDGSYHAVDSSDMAFQMAAKLAMKEGMAQCSPVLLEPIMKVEIFTPSDATAKIIALVPQRRGQILGYDGREGWPGWDMVEASMPQAEIGDLIIELRSATAGVATYRASFDRMAELTGRLADEATNANGKAA